MTALLLWIAAALGASPEAVEARLTEIDELRSYRIAKGAPALTSAEIRKAAQGIAVTGVVDVSSGPDKVYGAIQINLPIGQLWAALNDETRHPGFTAIAYSELLSGKVCQSGRHVLQFLEVPMMSDRWWIGILKDNPDIWRESGGSVRELTWRSSIDESLVTTESGKKIIAQGYPIGSTTGGWLLVAIDERSTWVEYFSQADPGGRVPSSMASSLASRGVVDTFAAIERFAKEGNPVCPVK